MRTRTTRTTTDLRSLPVCAVAAPRAAAYTGRMRRLVLLVLSACTGGDGQRPPDALHEGPDAAAGACADDSVFEPNDTLATAWPTPVGKTRDAISIAGLAICPASDTDHYAVTL